MANVYKHAYPEDAKGECRVTMEVLDGKRIHFRVRDNGVGIPEDVDIEGTETLGLKLIRNLVRKQLKGEVWFKNNGGMDIVAEFPVDHDDVLIHGGRDLTPDGRFPPGRESSGKKRSQEEKT
jgi:two-component sensor histidine kinase